MSAPGVGATPGVGGSVLLVALGGACGSLGRYGVGLALDGSAWATVLVNLSGAFALGWLVTALPSRRAPRARLLLATGLLGGYTTYSGFALDVVTSAADGHAARSLVLVVVTLVVGVVACAAGVALGKHRPDRSASS